MADFFGITVSGLGTVQRAMDVLSHNVANAYTEGYSRQTVDMVTRPAQETAQGAVGSGVMVGDIRRTFDQFLGQTLQGALTEQGRLQAQDQILGQIEQIIAPGDDSDLSSRLTAFFNAAQDVANAPTDLAVRSAFLGEAQTLVQQINTMDRRLADVETGVGQMAVNAGQEINELGGEIAQLNETILDYRRRFPGHEPNDLLDRRDLLVRNLSEKIDISTYQDGDGNINIAIGSGQSLVNAGNATPLVVENTPTGLGIRLGQADVTDLVQGGELGGLVRVKEEMLDPLRAELGRAVYSMASAFNTQHAQGYDLNNDPGTANFFNVTPLNTAISGEPTISPDGASTAYGLQVAITDVAALTAQDYTLKYEGTTWNLYKSGESAPVPVPNTALTPPAIYQGEGITITGSLPPTPGAGQPTEVVIRPMAGVMSGLAVKVTDPRDIAAAGSVIDSNGNLVSEGPGGNSNMLALAGLATADDVVAGSMTITDAFSGLIGEFGAQARSIRVNLEAQQVVVQQTNDQRESIVGVNLDEEAANLLRLQNQYMALSKTLSVAGTIFQSLIDAV